MVSKNFVRVQSNLPFLSAYMLQIFLLQTMTNDCLGRITWVAGSSHRHTAWALPQHWLNVQPAPPVEKSAAAHRSATALLRSSTARFQREAENIHLGRRRRQQAQPPEHWCTAAAQQQLSEQRAARVVGEAGGEGLPGTRQLGALRTPLLPAGHRQRITAAVRRRGGWRLRRVAKGNSNQWQEHSGYTQVWKIFNF